MDSAPSRPTIEQLVEQLCSQAERRGVVGFSSPSALRLLPEQVQYLHKKLAILGTTDVTAVSIGLFYTEDELLTVPAAWQPKSKPGDAWNQYAHAYGLLNRTLNQFTAALTEKFGGVAEQATVEGWAGAVGHVRDYWAHCVSHRAFAEAAGLGWRGRHSLLVTPEVGPALRFATWFVPGRIPPTQREHAGCGDCQACLDVCPVLRQGGEYREKCRRRLQALGLDDEVCGICVRVCWEQIRLRQRNYAGR